MAVQCNYRLRGRTVAVLSAGCPHSVGLIVGNCRQKVKSQLFQERGAVVTND